MFQAVSIRKFRHTCGMKERNARPKPISRGCKFVCAYISLNEWL
jgi:hypothetical protein